MFDWLISHHLIRNSSVIVFLLNSLLLVVQWGVTIGLGYITRSPWSISMFAWPSRTSSQITTSIDDSTGLSHAVFNSLSRNLTFWETGTLTTRLVCMLLWVSLHNGGDCGNCHWYCACGWWWIFVNVVTLEIIFRMLHNHLYQFYYTMYPLQWFAINQILLLWMYIIEFNNEFDAPNHNVKCVMKNVQSHISESHLFLFFKIIKEYITCYIFKYWYQYL